MQDDYKDAACNAVPELVQRIRELEEERDWLAQAAANAGWHGVRIGKEHMIEQARMATKRVQEEPHECPTPEVSCHARDGQVCMSDNYLACEMTKKEEQDSCTMRRFTLDPDYKDAAEFEARVAVRCCIEMAKLVAETWNNLFPRGISIPHAELHLWVNGRWNVDISECIKRARIFVEEEMESNDR